MDLNRDFREFIELLNEHNVEYVLVGGYAVILHGYPRYTGDIDFLVKPDMNNAKKVTAVLKEFGFGSLNVTPEEFSKPDFVLQLGYPPVRIDLITSISGVSFEEADNNKATLTIDDLVVPVLGLKQLRANKKASGRHKDLDDVEHLDF